ncbi:MAG: D-tyrosyl-tRNA(Tyr) deacylase [Syntrophobacterales bacterium]|jgi:D-tyrosyl-tRNA(Tyr) deacylase|nr:D-tyrosyl-tRNA(Tyr) deacylase [Syntrophobacterales bacterium]
MRAVLQRVKSASVSVGGEIVGKIGPGILALIGIHKDDALRDMEWMADKIVNLRIFETDEGRLDKSLLDTGGELLLVSQFTLYGNCSKGRRPSFSDAMDAAQAKKFFELFVDKVRGKVGRVETGIFQASMEIALVNDGPVTLIIDSRL